MNVKEIETYLKTYSTHRETEIILNNKETLLLTLNIHSFFKLYGVIPTYKEGGKTGKTKYLNNLSKFNVDYVEYLSNLIRRTGIFDFNKLLMIIYNEDKNNDCYANLIFLDDKDRPISVELFNNRSPLNYLTNETVCNIGRIAEVFDINELLFKKSYAFPRTFHSLVSDFKLTNKQVENKTKYMQEIAKMYSGELLIAKPSMINSTIRNTKLLLK